MAKDVLYMKKVREKAEFLCETFDSDAFNVMLTQRSLKKVTQYLDDYIKTGWITPLEINGKRRFHRGHMLILLQLLHCSDFNYVSGLLSEIDFEDFMSRRAAICEFKATDVKNDAKCIESLFEWLWSENTENFDPVNAVHMKAVIDLSLDKIDPNGEFDKPNPHKDDAVALLLHDLNVMQADINNIVTIASAPGSKTPTVQLSQRARKYEEIEKLLLPLHSPFLATPTRDLMAEERMEFLNERNQLLIEGNYEKLIELYETHIYLYETEVERHSNLCVCIGHIYGDLLKDSTKAADAFQEALEYDSSNVEAFTEVSHHLRESQNWDELITLLSNHWDTIDDPTKRCALILECAQIQAFKCQNIADAIGLYERCMLEGYPGNDFDNLYRIIAGLMDDYTDLEKIRAIVTLTLHIVNYTQCDKTDALRKLYDNNTDPLGMCLSKLIDAGLQSFRGDQPQALQTLCEAISYSPNVNLSDGLLLRIATKMRSNNEIREGLEELESESLSQSDFTNLWLRIANVLLRIPNRDEIALEYAEKSVTADPNNSEAIDLCYNLATKLQLPDRAFVYASLKAARAKNPQVKAELEATCRELKLAFGDDDDKLISAYETLLQFDDVKADVSEGLHEILLSVDNDKAIAVLQRLESKCMASGLSKLVEDIYQSVLDRDISTDLKKGLLERYLGFMLGQGAALNIENFIPAHAQLYTLIPSDRLFSMFKTAAKDNETAYKTWAGLLEDAVNEIDDKSRIAKIHMTLADCYQHIIKDTEKAAEAFANLLKAAPDNIPAFKCCFNAFERLGRYFECTEICKDFPLEVLTQQERLNYTLKSLIFALVHLYDANTMKFFMDLIAKDDEKLIPSVIEQIIDKANDENIDKDQLVCFLEQIEVESTGLMALSLRLAKARLLIELERIPEAADALDEDTHKQAVAANLDGKVVAAIETIDRDTDEFKTLSEIWLKIVTQPKDENKTSQETTKFEEQPDNKSNETHQKSAESIDALVKECADHLDDDTFNVVIEGALNTLSPEDQTNLCLKLGALYESHQKLEQADTYYQNAFKITSNLEIIEFYKRIRKIKKAIKLITNFKLPKAPEEEKNNIRLELVPLYEQIGRVDYSISTLNEVLNNRHDLDKNAIIAIFRQKAAYLAAMGQIEEAAATLGQASAEADIKSREDIDIDRCMLMREFSPAEAKKLQNSLKLRGAKSEKMTLLNLCFDIDADKYNDANNKIETLLASDNPVLRVSALELKLKMQKKRGDSAADLQKTAKELLEVSPQNPNALAVLNG